MIGEMRVSVFEFVVYVDFTVTKVAARLQIVLGALHKRIVNESTLLQRPLLLSRLLQLPIFTTHDDVSGLLDLLLHLVVQWRKQSIFVQFGSFLQTQHSHFEQHKRDTSSREQPHLVKAMKQEFFSITAEFGWSVVLKKRDDSVVVEFARWIVESRQDTANKHLKKSRRISKWQNKENKASPPRDRSVRRSSPRTAMP